MDGYLPFLEEVLTPRRLQHSLSVMKVMGELASVYDLDLERAVTAGLLHDAAKDLEPVQWQQLISEAAIPLYFDCDRNYLLYLHGPVGAVFMQKALGIKDPILLAAIESHTSYGISPYFDHPLCWCLRFADVLEPTRSWQEEESIAKAIQRLRKLVYEGRMAEAVVYQTGMLMKWFEVKGFPIHPNMRKANLRFADTIKDVEVRF